MPSKKLSIYEKFKTHRKYCRIKLCNACRPMRLAWHRPGDLSDSQPSDSQPSDSQPSDRHPSDRHPSDSDRSAVRGASRENKSRVYRVPESALRSELGRMQLSASESNERTFSERPLKGVQRVANLLVRTPNDLRARKSVSRDADGKLKDSTTLQDQASLCQHDRTASSRSSAESARTEPRRTGSVKMESRRTESVRTGSVRTRSARATVGTTAFTAKAPKRRSAACSVRLARLLVQLLLICKVNAQSIIKQSGTQQPASSASSLNSKSLASIKNAYTGKWPLLQAPTLVTF